MSTHQYHCKKCKSEFELTFNPVEVDKRGVVDESKGYTISFLVSSLSEQEIKDLPLEKDPRDYEKWETFKLKDIPEKPPCSYCGSRRTEKIMHEFEGWVKGNCFTNRERERKFYEKGYDKQQAQRFYEESMKASKERIQTCGDHYKPVAPDLDYFRKQGMIKKVSDKKRKERVENIDRMNQTIHKMAKIDPTKKA